MLSSQCIACKAIHLHQLSTRRDDHHYSKTGTQSKCHRQDLQFRQTIFSYKPTVIETETVNTSMSRGKDPRLFRWNV
jgi:ABC-type siderophore export system fused ATPase/permease subunit